MFWQSKIENVKLKGEIQIRVEWGIFFFDIKYILSFLVFVLAYR